MRDARLSGSTLVITRTANPFWLELISDGRPLARVNIVRALWYPEPRSDLPEPEPLTMTDAQLNALIDKATPYASSESLIWERR